MTGNARFPPVAEMTTAQPCDGVAEKVSLVPLTSSVSEGADYSRPAIQGNGTRPRKHRPSITSCDDVFVPICVTIRKATGLEASGPFLPGATWMSSRAPFPGKPRGAGAEQLMTVGHCEWKNRGVIVKPSLFLEGLVIANPTCRNCDRSADAGAYCSWCAAGIMANALNPHFRGRRKELHPGQGALPRRPGPTVGGTSGQQLLFR